MGKSNPCNIHTDLPLRKLCEEQGGMLMLGMRCVLISLLSFFVGSLCRAAKKKREKKSSTMHSMGSSMNQQSFSK
jgi:hypothetical protein